ncbi:MAG: type II toxin-antitoxin system YafQ family toxin [Mangrovibacterium sp.]
MYTIQTTNKFEKDFARCTRRNYDLDAFDKALRLLASSGKLPREYKPHKLKGKYAGFWECHIQPDWLMVWDQDDDKLTLLLMRTGTHSDLF